MQCLAERSQVVGKVVKAQVPTSSWGDTKKVPKKNLALQVASSTFEVAQNNAQRLSEMQTWLGQATHSALCGSFSSTERRDLDESCATAVVLTEKETMMMVSVVLVLRIFVQHLPLLPQHEALTAEAREIHRTQMIKDNLDPEWHEARHRSRVSHDNFGFQGDFVMCIS